MSKRAAIKQLIQQYYFQLTEGCGKTSCSNQNCASSSSFSKLSQNDAAVQAIALYNNKAVLCEKHPSKMAKTAPDQESSSTITIDNHVPSSSMSSTGDLAPSSSKQMEVIQSQPDLIVAHGNTTNLLQNNIPVSQELINNQLKKVSVSEEEKEKEQNRKTEEKERRLSYEKDYNTLLNLQDLLNQSENGTMSTIKKAIWNVFSNSDCLNHFCLDKEKVKSQLAKDEDKDIDETDVMDIDSAPAATLPLNNNSEQCVATTSATLPGNQLDICPTVDMTHVRELYKLCTKHTELETVMYNSITYLIDDTKTRLIREKNFFKNKSNYLNMFVILMENCSLDNPEAFEKTFPSFCKIMSLLPIEAQAELAKFWSGFDAVYLRNMIESLQQLITIKVVTDFSDETSKTVQGEEAITCAAKCLNILFYASIMGGEMHTGIDEAGATVLKKARAEAKMDDGELDMLMQDQDDTLEFHWEDQLSKQLNVNRLDSYKPKIPLKEFVNEALNENIQSDQDYANYKLNQHGSSRFSFLHYPFLLNIVNKTACLFYDNRFRMTSERRRTFLSSFVQGALINPYLKIQVRRNHIIDDTLVQLELAAESNGSFKKQLFVEFDGEEGVDEGGVSKEFFQLVVEKIFNPDNGMFIYNEQTNLFWFNQHSFETQVQYKLIGIVLGLAIYNNCILDINFPSFVYKKLLGRKATFHDMADSHPLIYQSLKSVLEHEGNVEDDLMVTYQVQYADVFGGSLTHNLKENGENIPVTNENRQEYVDMYSDWLLNTSIAGQFNAFLSGFDLVVNGSPLKYLFLYDELELLIRGSEDYNFDELEESTEYDGGFTKDSPTVKAFWSVVHELDEADKRKLLQFTTGSDRAPVGGLSKLRMIIARHGPDSFRLPTAHTCFNVLLIPDYRNRQKLKERLLKAISYSKGFGML
uniref:HECT-type E3 ubiquitin transferase n=1 Tax=Phallusia mammillata TaxID=59560 RepID=A0A6F9DWP2_9ASCI|nr:ubiquitin-protein ligase E3A-like [Phallusia mammillata]